MNAKELRIGNWYNVFSIPKQADALLILKLQQIEAAGKTAIDVSPIPLTEEWLIRFGFKIRSNPNNPDNSFFWDNGEVKMIQSDKLYCSDIVSTIEIKHVHQLQNLYFALTGEEL